MPLSLHPAQLVLRHLIVLAHTLPLFFCVAAVLHRDIGWQALFALAGLALDTANLLWITLLLGTLGARFRDLEYIVGMVMPLLMFLSPIFYRPDALPFAGPYIWLNPLADMIELVRYPLLGEPIPLFLWQANLAMLAVGVLVTLWLFDKKRNVIPYWL